MPRAMCADTIVSLYNDSSPDAAAVPELPNRARCGICGQWYPADDGACPGCVACDRCQRTVAEDDTVDTVRGSVICQDCLYGYYWHCTECDGWNRDGDSCGNGCCDPDCNCDSCRPGRFGGLVEDYDYKPSPVFNGTGPLYLGAEIELDTPYGREGECAQLAGEALGSLGYLKADSSIEGFEIVTHPMSYEWAMANFPWAMLTELQDAGCSAGAGAGTGIHVHVSRAGFDSPCHAYRWMKFVYRNQRQVITLARRSSPEWAAFTDDDRRAVKDYAKGGCGSRYQAINPNNTATFELRVFAGSLDPGQVQAALAFAAASVEYTRDLSVAAIAHHAGWGWRSFVAWLADRPVYQPLTAQLEALQCVC
jgi:hypothetical protein